MSQRPTAGDRRRPLDTLEWVALLGLALLLLLPTGGVLAISLAMSPDALDGGGVQLTPTCPHRRDGGPGCATCGMTRAFTAASRGRLGDAWRFNHAALPLYAGTLTVFTLSLTTTAVAARGLRRRLSRSKGTNR